MPRPQPGSAVPANIRYFAVAAVLALGLARAEPPPLPDTCLVINGVRQAARAPTWSDPVEHAIVLGTWTPPTEAAPVQRPDGETRTWERAAIDDDGRVDASGLRGAYVYVALDSPSEQTVLLNARGHSMVYVNGSPRAGDPYGYGFLRLPIQLRAGRNDLLFSCSRGSLQISLEEPPAACYLSADDMTVPDHLDDREKWLGVVVVNASDTWRQQMSITPIVAGKRQKPSPVGVLAPHTLRKVPVRVEGGSKFQLVLTGNDTPLDVALRERTPEQVHRRTFRSRADGSVQYYAVRPATKPGPDNALILSLHGASVEALRQAEAYGPHEWATIVCPTNRRPFGFDWEDWGRVDALEVLDDAEGHYPHDPQRTCLTGHSMGGHGVWQLAALYPDRWAAIGPSAGWISFATYAGGKSVEGDDPKAEALRRATATSDTLAMLSNFMTIPGVFILHGDADDNVPVGQAREMKRHLADHPNLHYHEQEGAGHWWDDDPAEGAACVDFKPMFDLFERSRIPKSSDVREIDFTTVSPRVSDTCHWVRIVSQIEPLRPSRVRATYDPGTGACTVQTENVAGIELDLARIGLGLVSVTIDGSTIEGTGSLFLSRSGWTRVQDVVGDIAASVEALEAESGRESWKSELFLANHAQRALTGVIATGGSSEMLRTVFDKARFDAETFYYRGNGNFEIQRDGDALGDPDIRYGNLDIARDWHPDEYVFRPRCTVRNGVVQLGEELLTGEDLAVLESEFYLPRTCSVSVAATGVVGMRLTHRIPYFVSGIDYPPLTVIGPEMLVGDGVTGIRVAEWGE